MINIKLMVVDADYLMDRNNNPVIRLYGKVVGGENEEKDVVIHVAGMEPYFYIRIPDVDIFELKKEVEEKFKTYIKRVEIVKQFLPVGYQVEKSNFLRLVLYSPKVVRDLRQLLKDNIENMSDSCIYEGDIQFKNRYMIDADIDGSSIIEFNEKGKELRNYGTNCNNLYLVDKDDIRVLKNETVNIEY